MTLAELLALLPDNTNGQIGADDIRTLATSLWERTDGTAPVEAIAFDTTPPVHVQTAGHMHWNATENTLEVDVSADGSLQVGYEMWINARNTTGSTILDGTPVRIISGGGNNALISPDNGQGQIVGVATENIANNANGRVTSFGVVHDLNTSAFADGALLFATAAGGLTTSTTSSFVGIVLNSSPTGGTILVSPDSRTSSSGTTAARPTTVTIGFEYFDTTLGLPIFWKGAVWVNGAGATV